jgi:hypothetical protein
LPESLSRPAPAAREPQNGLTDDEAAVMMILEESSKAATEKKVA